MGVPCMLRKILAAVLTLLAILFGPLLILLLPIYLLRLFIGHLATIFRPDLGKMLSPRSNLFAVELSEMFSRRTRCPIYVSHVVDGPLDIDKFRKFFLDQAVNRRLEDTNELQSPELQQTITSWMGYLFWKWDPDFQIQNHIKHYYFDEPERTVTDEDIPLFMKELSAQPFPEGRSPWEIWVWAQARLARDPLKKPKSICVVRVHHSLADGYSILRLLAEDIAGSVVPMPFTIPSSRGIALRGKEPPSGGLGEVVKRGWNFLRILFMAPYELINNSITSWDFNEWHMPEEKLTARLNTTLTTAIPVEELKAIKKIHGITFNAVLQCAFAGGVRNFMIEHKVKVPKAIHCMVPLPMPGHPGKLRNHMTAVLAPLPVGLPTTQERIRAVHECLRKIHKSAIPYGAFYLLPLVGALPAWVVKIFATNLVATCLLSNFPAPSHPVYLMGQRIDDIVFGGGLLVGNIGIGLSSLSYNGNIRLGAGIDEAIFQNPEEVRSLVRKIEEELDIMRAMEIV